MSDLTLGGKAVKSIPTRYRGILFRSALEAKWARGMDAAGVKWTYEPEGVMLPSGRVYIPDFELASGQYLEVKGVVRAADLITLTDFCAHLYGGETTRCSYPVQVVVGRNDGVAVGIGLRRPAAFGDRRDTVTYVHPCFPLLCDFCREVGAHPCHTNILDYRCGNCGVHRTGRSAVAAGWGYGGFWNPIATAGVA